MSDWPMGGSEGRGSPLVKTEAIKKQFSQETMLSVALFLLGALFIVVLGAFQSLRTAVMTAGKLAPLSMPLTIAIVMMTISAIMVLFCKINVGKIIEGSVFRTGMMAVIIVLGVAWMSNTVVAVGIALGIPGSTLVGMFPAVACCFILPTSSSMVEEENWYPVTNFVDPPVGSNPFGIQGYKTISYENMKILATRYPKGWAAVFYSNYLG